MYMLAECCCTVGWLWGPLAHRRVGGCSPSILYRYGWAGVGSGSACRHFTMIAACRMFASLMCVGWGGQWIMNLGSAFGVPDQLLPLSLP
jgi:hypothetical protein